MNKPDDADLTIKRRVAIFNRMHATMWHVRPAAVAGYFSGAFLKIAGMLVYIYATAKLGSLLAAFVNSGNTNYIWLWLWVGIAAVVFIALGFLVMSFCKRVLYFSFVRWTVNSFLVTLCQLDLANFYDAKVRNRLNKVGGGYIWQLPNLSDICLDLIYGQTS